LDDIDNELDSIIKYIKYSMIAEKVNKPLLEKLLNNIDQFVFNIFDGFIFATDIQLKFFIDIYIEKFKLLSNNLLSNLVIILNDLGMKNIEFLIFEYFMNKSLENNLRENLLNNLKTLFSNVLENCLYDNIVLQYIQSIENIDKSLFIELNKNLFLLLENFPHYLLVKKIISIFIEQSDLMSNDEINLLMNSFFKYIFNYENPFLYEYLIKFYTYIFYVKFKKNLFEESINYMRTQDLTKLNGYFKYALINHYGDLFNKFFKKIGKEYLLDNLENCPICYEDTNKIYITNCNHRFCVECIKKTILYNIFNNNGISCPYCRKNNGKYCQLTDIRFRNKNPFNEIKNIIRKNFDIGLTKFSKNNIKVELYEERVNDIEYSIFVLDL
jgi:hypothetical protein